MTSVKTDLADQQSLFQSQIESHKGIIFKVVSSYAWLAEDQQDLAQEITLQLWRAYPKYDPSRTFSTWMYQVALNTAISWARKWKLRNQHLTTAEELADIPEPTSEGLDSQALYSLIAGLDEFSRALLMLYIEERSHAEIGEILGISPQNVATKLTRLKQRLRLEVEQQS
ncbi:MAG: sigma-70 family RNA polymerase sigma factor [Fimbriimonadaceae bacterium]|nr:sigma-70 family RNA polymerase sigma factor [Fimbriimonadaceae bacterium]